MAKFDPYYKWFAIKPDQQPPNFYRLLGVELFESDADVIDTASDQRMTFLQSCANGEHAALSQRMMNEVSTARVTLLNNQKRQAYDKQLRAKLNESSAPANDSSSLAQAVSIKTRPKTRGIAARRKKKPSPLPMILGTVAIATIAIIAVMLTTGDDDPPENEGGSASQREVETSKC